MPRDQFFCPAEECRFNRAGYCGARGEGIGTPVNVIQNPGRMYGADMPGTTSGTPGDLTGISGPLGATTWRNWENCPYIHHHEI